MDLFGGKPPKTPQDPSELVEPRIIDTSLTAFR
jgi:hypothetical protein